MSTLKKVSRLVRATGRRCFSQPGEAFLLFRMACWIGVLSAAVKLFSLPRALELVSGTTSTNGESSPESPDRLARAIDLLLSADVLFLKPICWKRAAVLRRYLLKKGFATKIIFGVKPENKGTVSGHAWLELDGQPILENAPPEYVVTYVFPPEEDSPSQLAFLPID